MSAKRDKFTKGRRTKPATMGKKVLRSNKTAGKTAVRVTRKQKDVKNTGGTRKVNKSPRRVPAREAEHRKY